MKIANISGRAALFTGTEFVDVHKASDGAFGPDPVSVFDQWTVFLAWARSAYPDAVGVEATLPADAEVGPPSPRPRQVFGVGLNYTEHAKEAGFDLPETPVVFTKFPTSVAGPDQTIALPDGSVDWEVELVVVIGAHAHRIEPDRAWEAVAGLTLGQDLSERQLQHKGPAPQFSLAKSFPGFSPTGPVLVTPDEFADPNDLNIGCRLNGETMQDDRTSDMIFPIGPLVSWLSHITPLCPGDIIFTGTPSGIGASRTPPRFLSPGDELVSWMEGVGTIRTVVAGPAYAGPGVPAVGGRGD
ncbi:fumarylacetoacetate hydrolase family protein [Actinocorallia sp. A-T 12471]|uniref:fumarylacetoacetate hydrolase family protein n=1 Tax=Actinocorallia sp. A-T 12471 TaxID=3089813 RepID=UPI0029CEF8B0|nr:fumarylacetoacetate hydrolase family protein [Actinocorallia sp. A-T 12471]MDX6744180.1 fumarylacetoacetate hydrolase family protein [Actinocorallia sp. A-T 12471]